jgi:cell division septation protein DedD
MEVKMRGAALSIALMLLGVAACTPEQRDWRVAQGADTLDAYDRFITEHPDGTLAREARDRIVQLTDDRDWQRAASADSERAYHEYLVQHPNGKQAQQARIRIDSFALAARASSPDGVPNLAPDSATLGPRAAVPAQRAAATPARVAAPPPASPVRASATQAPTPISAGATPDYAIQLGAFTSEAKARAQWELAVASHRAQLTGLTAHIDPVLSSGTPLYRLQARVGAESRARTLCAALTEHAQPCVVVPPRR